MDQRFQVGRDGRQQDVAAVHGVAHGEVPDQKIVVPEVAPTKNAVFFLDWGAGDEGASVEEVNPPPGTAGGGGEEGGAGEVEAGEGAGGDGGGVRWLGLDEGAIADHADERRRVEGAVAVEEGVVGDETAEGAARRGGAGLGAKALPWGRGGGG